MTHVVKVTYEDGHWLAEGSEPSFATFARTLAKLREHVVDAIALGLEVERMDAGERDPHVDRNSVDVEFDVKLPGSAGKARAAALRRRAQAADAEQAATVATLTAVEELSELGVSQRDAAELLNLSHQRIGQLARSGR